MVGARTWPARALWAASPLGGPSISWVAGQLVEERLRELHRAQRCPRHQLVTTHPGSPCTELCSSPEGRSPSAGCLAPVGRLPPPLGALRLPSGADVPSTPAAAAALSLRTTVRRGCSAARPPGGRRGVPVTKRRNLRVSGEQVGWGLAVGQREAGSRRARAGCPTARVPQSAPPRPGLRCALRRGQHGPSLPPAPQPLPRAVSAAPPALLHRVQLAQHFQQRAHRR